MRYSCAKLAVESYHAYSLQQQIGMPFAFFTKQMDMVQNAPMGDDVRIGWK